MALDEVLLASAVQPILRQYRWSEPWISFGYTQSLSEAMSEWPGIPAVRRWTGGGIVPHLGDWTFSLVVPRDSAFAAERPAESYRIIHHTVANALKLAGVSARLATMADRVKGSACFVSPTPHDLLSPEGIKLCGGAQRRTRRGFLHQGSIQHIPVEPDLAVALSHLMAAQIAEFPPSRQIEHDATSLAATKYGTQEWATKIP